MSNTYPPVQVGPYLFEWDEGLSAYTSKDKDPWISGLTIRPSGVEYYRWGSWIGNHYDSGATTVRPTIVEVVRGITHYRATWLAAKLEQTREDLAVLEEQSTKIGATLKTLWDVATVAEFEKAVVE